LREGSGYALKRVKFAHTPLADEHVVDTVM
jgi:hypothetical protein